MSADDDFVASDTIAISRLAFDYRADPDVIEAGSLEFFSVCAEKQSGKREIVLNLQILGLADLDFYVIFNGTPMGVDSQGRALTEWSINQSVNRPLPSYGATLRTVSGHFRTVFANTPVALLDTTCIPQGRYHRTIFSTVGSDNQLKMSLEKTIAGVSHGGTLTLDNLALVGSVGEPLELKVRIVTDSDRCHPLTAGGITRFRAVATGIPAGLIEQYDWAVHGGIPLGPLDDWQLAVEVPDENQVKVDVRVTVEQQTAVAASIVNPVPQSTARIIHLLCKIRMLARHDMFVRPLWDPLRRLSIPSLSDIELQAFSTTANELLEITRELTAALSAARSTAAATDLPQGNTPS
jgi:hypothetical protein